MVKRIVDSDSDSDAPLGDPSSPTKQQQPATNGHGINGNGKRQRPPVSKSSDISSSPRASTSKLPSFKKIKRDTDSSPQSARTKVASSNGNGKQPRSSAAKTRKEGAVSSDDEPLAAPAKQMMALAIPTEPLGPVVDADMPLATTAAAFAPINPPTAKQGDVAMREAAKAKQEEASDDEDQPLGQKVRAPAPRKSRTKAAKEESDASDSDDVALSRQTKRKASALKATPAKKGKKAKGSESSDVDSASSSTSPPPKKARAGGNQSKSVKPKAKKESVPASSQGTPSRRKTKKDEEEDAEDQFRWWEQQQQENDGSQKWTTLEHSGVLFPPAYEPLPRNVKLVYDGKPVDLPPESEEVAGFFGAMLETDHAKDETFQKNFFKDFLGCLKKFPPRDGTKIQQFSKCDFSQMLAHFEDEKAKKKSLTAAEKKEIKATKDEMEAKYVYCTLDGRKEKVGNFRAEPPGLFRGRGEHPKKGCWKHRLRPEDITINIGEDVEVPQPNVPGKWAKVMHDNTVTWLAHWKENINGNAKYVFLAAGSSLKGQSDMMKFEKARELKQHVDRIRAEYSAQLTSRVTAERQLATALYFIDRLALRAGNEKGEDEADTVGCCSLRYEHVTLLPPDQLVFDFLGKDSIRYYNTIKVEPQVYKNIRIFKGDGKVEGDMIFDRVQTTNINKHLTSYMKGLTAKVFRTYNASWTFQKLLDESTPKNGSLIEKLGAYNEANRMVAILCNHQKSVSKNHGAAMEKMSNQIADIKYQRRKLRYALFTLDKKFKKKKELAEEESDIDDEWIETYEDESRAKEIEKAEKKFEKDNEKLVAEGGKALKKDVLRERIDKINEEYDRLMEERGTKNATLKGNSKSPEQILANIEKIDERIKTAEFKREDRDKGKEVSLGTSKINYLDPRITAAWCKEHSVPIEKLFSKTLIVKFPWALEVEPSWKF